MTAKHWIQICLFVGVLVACAKPLGWFMSRVFQGQPCGLDRVFGPLERWMYRLAGVDPQSEMSWKSYAIAAMLVIFVPLVIGVVAAEQAGVPAVGQAATLRGRKSASAS